MKHLKKYEDYSDYSYEDKTIERELLSFEDELEEIGWEYTSNMMDADVMLEYIDPNLGLQIGILIGKTIFLDFYEKEERSEDFANNFDYKTEIADFNILSALLNDIVDFVKSVPKIDILEHQNIKIPDIYNIDYIEDLYKYNEEMREIIQKHDYLFNATDMGLL